MKEYGNKLEVYLVDDISSISGTTITPTLDQDPISINSSNDIIPDEQQAEIDGTVYYTQRLNVFTDKLTEVEVLNLLDRKVIIKLFYTGTEEILLGSLDNPARCKAQPFLNQDSLKIVSESPYPLLP